MRGAGLREEGVELSERKGHVFIEESSGLVGAVEGLAIGDRAPKLSELSQLVTRFSRSSIESVSTVLSVCFLADFMKRSRELSSDSIFMIS